MIGGRVRGVLGAAAVISMVTIAARVAGIVRYGVFSANVGAGAIGQAYTTANTLPNVMFEVAAGGALAGVVVPLLAGPLARRDADYANRVASALLTWTITILVPLSILVALAAPWLTDLMLPGHPKSATLAAQLLVVFAPQVALYGIGVVLGGILQADRRFFWPACAPLLSSLVVICAYLAYGAASQPGANLAQQAQTAVTYLGWGTTAGVVVLSLPLLIPTWRAGIRLRWTYRFPPGVVGRLKPLALAGLGALIAQQGCVLAVMYMANAAGDSSTLVTYQYAQTVYMLPYAVLAVPLATSAFPHLAATAGKTDRAVFARGTAAIIRAVVAVAAVGTVALIVAAPQVEAVFKNLDLGTIVGLSGTISYLALGLVGFSLIALLSRVLYALDHGREAGVATAIGWASAAISSWLMIRPGLVASPQPEATQHSLAIGMAIGMSVAGALLLVMVIRVLGGDGVAGLARTGLVALAGAVPAVLIGRWLGLQWLPGSVIGAIASGVVCAVIAIGVLAVIMIVFDRGLLHAVSDIRGRS